MSSLASNFVSTLAPWTDSKYDWNQRVQFFPYLRQVNAMGFKAYEKAHRQNLVALLNKRGNPLPEELIDRVVAYWAHAGDYFSAGVVSAEQIAEADEVLAGASLRLREIKHKLPSSRAAALEDVIARLRRV